MKIRVLEGGVGGVYYGDPVYLEEVDFERLECCPVCNDTAAQTVLGVAEGRRSVGLVWSHCGVCTHVYLSRRPKAEWFQHYYAEIWDSGHLNPQVSGAMGRVKRGLKAIPPVRRLVRAVKRLVKPVDITRGRRLSMFAGLGGAANMNALPVGARILEIGSGYGDALTLFQEAGFDAYGTEASRYRTQVCRTEGLKVFQTDIDNFGPVEPYGPFDLIYSSHVFEHLLDLQTIMRRLTPLVKDGGVIYVEVPNGPVCEHLVHRVHDPGHCHIFSPRSLSTLLEGFGFRVVRMFLDLNLHMVACKSAEEFPSLCIGGESRADALLPGRHALSSADGAVIFHYDHFYVVMERADDGHTLYQRPAPYAVVPQLRPGSEQLINRFVLVVDGSEPGNGWPVRFVHDSDLPPMWPKRQ